MQAGIFANLSTPPDLAIILEAAWVPINADKFGAINFILDSIYASTMVRNEWYTIYIIVFESKYLIA